MGMGDQHPKPIKRYQKQCAILGLYFDEALVRKCPHPAVQKYYGEYVSHYGCIHKRCKYLRRVNLFGGYTCIYGLELSKRE